MVTVKRRSKHFRYKQLKIQTIATVSIGCAGMWLLSEPMWHDLYHKGAAIVIEKRQRQVGFDSYPLAKRHVFLHVAGRMSLFQRGHVRKSTFLEDDPLTVSPCCHHVHQKSSLDQKRIIYLHEYSATVDDSSPGESLGPISRQVDPMSSLIGDQDLFDFRRDFERPFLDACRPIVELHVNPTCNLMHEIGLKSDIGLLSTQGSWRSVWKIDHHEAVLKLLSLSRSFDQTSLESHAVDAMVMDRLTASPYVVSAFGYCAQSVITEMANTSGRDYIKQYEIRTKERLKIARDLARGLAEIQELRHIKDFSVTRDPLVVFAHNDINIANTVQIGGTVKWNDFNIGVLLRRHNETDCGAPVRYRADMWRSPEEIFNKSYVKPQESDVYSFGNVLYQVMTRHQPWTFKEPLGKLSIEEIVERKKNGTLPTIPEQYKNSTRNEIHGLLYATEACFQLASEKRPTAYQIAQSLGRVFDLGRSYPRRRVASEAIRNLFTK